MVDVRKMESAWFIEQGRNSVANLFETESHLLGTD